MNRNFIRTFFSLLPVLAFLVSGAYAAPAGYKGYPRGNALITVQELKGLIDAAGLPREDTSPLAGR